MINERFITSDSGGKYNKTKLFLKEERQAEMGSKANIAGIKPSLSSQRGLGKWVIYLNRRFSNTSCKSRLPSNTQ